jgi:multidrug resistance efflux pump
MGEMSRCLVSFSHNDTDAQCSQQSAKVDGYLTEVAVQDNQAVYRGDMAKLHLGYTLITAP